MRLLLSVQRYGEEVAGGAEQLARQLATRMVERGHRVEVATSCAQSYLDWADAYPPGTTDIDGVTVHRLPVARPRDPRTFGLLHGRAVVGHRPSALTLQEAWLAAEGPDLPALPGLVRRLAPDVDAVAAFTYLYPTSRATLAAAGGLAPTVVHPTAHDETELWLPVFDPVLALPDAVAASTPEELALLRRRAGHDLPGAVIGIGADLEPAGDGGRFRRAFGLGDRPFLLYTGRLDTAKAVDELHAGFVAYRQRRPERDLALVAMGQPVLTFGKHPDVVVTGFVDDQVRADAVAACLAMVVPSYQESFSMALTEAWAAHRPALVQAGSPVLLGQARRSGGALAYTGYGEFEAAVDLLVERPALRAALAAQGRRHVVANYHWDAVLGRYEALLDAAGRRHRARRRQRLRHPQPRPAGG